MIPKSTCSPPKPAPSNQFPQAGGEKSARIPINIRKNPITGTTRTEKAPAVITPTPDAYTMLLLMVPLVFLYELSIILVWLFGRKGKSTS